MKNKDNNSPTDNEDMLCEKRRLLNGEDNFPFYILVILVSIGLLCFVPSQARIIDTDKGWFLQPMIAPLIGLGIMAIFSLVMVAGKLKEIFSVDLKTWSEYLYDSVSYNRVPVITSVFFYIYIHMLNVTGFFLTTLLFVTVLLALSRLLNRYWFIATFLVTVAIAFIFRYVIGLWMDDVWLYEFLPNDWSDFANSYL
ncbi:MAG: tripartite tricarboxylate transporter TctB family protein [Oceanospirillales bacterium]|nr:tripartite tricarboxylate transporter TctB family protein [Oceanospirillales bacterium]MBR9888720.1 tripartite tricarboxylate transporter TctB family protein [Oceanospirillales bacterium]